MFCALSTCAIYVFYFGELHASYWLKFYHYRLWHFSSHSRQRACLHHLAAAEQAATSFEMLGSFLPELFQSCCGDIKATAADSLATAASDHLASSLFVRTVLPRLVSLAEHLSLWRHDQAATQLSTECHEVLQQLISQQGYFTKAVEQLRGSATVLLSTAPGPPCFRCDCGS